MLEKAEKELKTEFIPELYDKNMSKIFNEKYYDMSEDEQDLEENKEIDMNLLKDNDEDMD